MSQSPSVSSSAMSRSGRMPLRKAASPGAKLTPMRRGAAAAAVSAAGGGAVSTVLARSPSSASISPISAAPSGSPVRRTLAASSLPISIRRWM